MIMVHLLGGIPVEVLWHTQVTDWLFYSVLSSTQAPTPTLDPTLCAPPRSTNKSCPNKLRPLRHPPIYLTTCACRTCTGWLCKPRDRFIATLATVTWWLSLSPQRHKSLRAIKKKRPTDLDKESETPLLLRSWSDWSTDNAPDYSLHL